MEFHPSCKPKKPAKAETLSAAEVIGANGDLVTEILKLVPAKTLIRWRSVCKEWLSLISSPRFSLLHWQHQSLSGRIVTGIEKSPLIRYIPMKNNNIGNNESLEMFPLYTSTTYRSVVIEDSCNGLILLNSLSHRPRESRSYYVSNPTTRKIYTLPAPFSPSTYYYCADGAYLLFDPLKSLHYKVVLLHTDDVHNGTNYCHIHIYSSETNTWWETNSAPPHSHLFEEPIGRVDFRNGVSCNGNVHWPSLNPHSTSLFYDVDHRTLRSMPSTPFQRSSASRDCVGSRLFASRGHLHAIDYDYAAVGFNVFISEMECDYSNWSPKYRVCLNQSVLRMERDISFIPGEDGADAFLVLLVGSNIIYYNIRDNTSNKLQVLLAPGDELFFHAHARFHPFMETLFPV